MLISYQNNLLVIGMKYMSLVQAIITEKFILVGADNRGIHPDGRIIETCNKLIKLNNNIIFGCTGGILDNFKLFDGYCYYSDKCGLSNSEDKFNISYNDFVDTISERFNIMLNEQRERKAVHKYEICSMICGYNGKEFEATTFSIGSKYNYPDGIIKVTKAINFPYKGVSAGKVEHLHMLEELVQKTYFKYGNVTMRQYKNILYEIFENGATTDETINNIVRFESIRKKDVN